MKSCLSNVSIITAVYNCDKYISETIDNVIKQTLNTWEYIIIDDGSTDSTKTKIHPYLSDKRIKYYYQDNQGQAVARNKAFSLSNGKYIAILDADDIWHPQKIERQINIFEKNPKLGLVYTGIQKIDENGHNLSTKKTVDITKTPLKHQIVSNEMAFSSFIL